MWVIQELFFAGNLEDTYGNRCTVVCGNRSLPLAALYKLWKYMEIIETSLGSYDVHGHAWLYGDTSGVEEPLRSFVEFGPLHG